MIRIGLKVVKKFLFFFKWILMKCINFIDKVLRNRNLFKLCFFNFDYLVC